MDELKSFLQDLKNNTQVNKLIGNPQNLIDNFIADIDNLSLSNKGWSKLKLQDTDNDYYQIVDGVFKWKVPLGIVLDNRADGLINRPTCVRKIDNSLWVGGYNSNIKIFDEHLNLISEFGVYGTSGNNRISYYYRFAVNDTYVVIPFPNGHYVRIYDKSNGQLIRQIGTTTVGDAENNLFHTPYDVLFMPNGNLLISDTNGGYGNCGYLAEFDIDGNFIKYHLKSNLSGNAWENEVCEPNTIKFVSNNNGETELWVGYYNRQYIGVFVYDDVADEFQYKRLYGKTQGTNVGIYYVSDFDIADDYSCFFVGLGSSNVVAKVDIASGDVLGVLGYSKYEDYNDNPKTIGGFGSINSISCFDKNVYVADYTNNRVQSFPIGLFDTALHIFSYDYIENNNLIDIVFATVEDFNIESNTIQYSARLLLERIPPRYVYVGGIRACDIKDD